MLRKLAFILAVIFALAGLAVLATDVGQSLRNGGGPELQPLGAWWAWVDRGSLLLLQPAIERHLTPALWDPGVQTLLEWPAALDLLGLAALFGLVAYWRGRGRARRSAAARRG
jgi:hypothetical protein